MPSEKRIIIGLGCGRCGTASLATLLDSQRDSHVTHEMTPHLPWLAWPDVFKRRMTDLLALPGKVVGDVAFFMLPYTPFLWRDYPEARTICLRRERASCIASLVAKMKSIKGNYYQHHNGTQQQHRPGAEMQLPKYEHCPSMKAAITHYYDDYYHQAEWFAGERPDHFHIFPLEMLNTSEGVMEILDFAGYARSAQHVLTGIRLNAGQERNTDPDL